MPIVSIEISKGFDAAYKKALLDGIHEALVESFKIPEGDRNQLLREYEALDFERSEGKSKNFTIIEIKVFKGRSRDAKRSLYQNITRNLEKAPGIRPTDVLITLVEPELVNWGVSGGKCADETDLGFKIDV